MKNNKDFDVAAAVSILGDDVSEEAVNKVTNWKIAHGAVSEFSLDLGNAMAFGPFSNPLLSWKIALSVLFTTPIVSFRASKITFRNLHTVGGFGLALSSAIIIPHFILGVLICLGAATLGFLSCLKVSINIKRLFAEISESARFVSDHMEDATKVFKGNYTYLEKCLRVFLNNGSIKFDKLDILHGKLRFSFYPNDDFDMEKIIKENFCLNLI